MEEGRLPSNSYFLHSFLYSSSCSLSTTGRYTTRGALCSSIIFSLTNFISGAGTPPSIWVRRIIGISLSLTVSSISLLRAKSKGFLSSRSKPFMACSSSAITIMARQSFLSLVSSESSGTAVSSVVPDSTHLQTPILLLLSASVKSG